MSKRIYVGKFILIALLLAAAAICVYFYNANSDEKAIRKLLDTLVQDLSKTPGESTAAALLKVNSASTLFTDPLMLSMDKYASGSFSREQQLSHLGRYRTMIADARITISDLHLELKSPTEAAGYFSARFSGSMKNGMSDTIIKEVDIQFVKSGKKWLISSVQFRNILH